MNFNPVEIFKIARKLEENGKNFYLKAAEFAKDSKIASKLQEMADMEADHYVTFSRLEKGVKHCSYQESDEIAAYLDTEFGPEIFEHDDTKRIGHELSTVKAVLEFALEQEIKAGNYYKKARAGMTDQDTMAALDHIIKEEDQHVQLIKDYLKEI